MLLLFCFHLVFITPLPNTPYASWSMTQLLLLSPPRWSPTQLPWISNSAPNSAPRVLWLSLFSTRWSDYPSVKLTSLLRVNTWADTWLIYVELVEQTKAGLDVYSARQSAGRYVFRRPIWWQERQPNRPLSISIVQTWLVCLLAWQVNRPGRTSGSAGNQTGRNIYR